MPRKILNFLHKLNNLIDNTILDKMIEGYTKKDEKANVIIRKRQTKVNLTKYLYACYMYLIISTFVKAIVKNNFIT